MRLKVMTDTTEKSQASSPDNIHTVPPTNATLLGEIVWLMTQVPIYKQLKIGDLEWLVMPPLLLKQFKLFYDEANKPIGLALWAFLNQEGEERLKNQGRIEPQDWANGAHMSPTAGLVPASGGTPWLIELIAPYHTEEVKHRDFILSDLMSTVFVNRQLKLIHLNPTSGKKEVLTLGEVI
jgi:cytolysin-activating lysine-acyltransferase